MDVSAAVTPGRATYPTRHYSHYSTPNCKKKRRRARSLVTRVLPCRLLLFPAGQQKNLAGPPSPKVGGYNVSLAVGPRPWMERNA
jgi:hypothetical protein